MSTININMRGYVIGRLCLGCCLTRRWYRPYAKRNNHRLWWISCGPVHIVIGIEQRS